MAYSLFNSNINIATAPREPDSTTLPVSSHATSLKNSHTTSFLDLAKYQPQLTGGAGVLQTLLLSGADSIKVESDQDITITGDLRTETGAKFDRSVGSGISSAGYAAGPGHSPASIVEVDGTTLNLFKGRVVEIHRIDQTNTQPNSLIYTLNGLSINQHSPHITTVHGTYTKIVAGTTNEDIVITNAWSMVLGSSSGEQYRGLHLKGVTGASADLFAGMRSEFVELVQINLTFGWGFIFHVVLKVLQIAGSAAGAFKAEWAFVEGKMQLLETKVNGLRARIQGYSGRGGGLLLGIWRIFF